MGRYFRDDENYAMRFYRKRLSRYRQLRYAAIITTSAAAIYFTPLRHISLFLISACALRRAARVTCAITPPGMPLS